MHVPLPRHQQQLFLGEIRIDQGKCNAMKGEIPGGIPRVFPLVRHRDHVGIVKMPPVRIPALETFARRLGPGWVAFEPAVDVVMIKLLAPEQTGQRLTHNIAAVPAGILWNDRSIELLRFVAALRHKLIEFSIERLTRRRRKIAETEPSREACAWLQYRRIMRCRFGSRRVGTYAVQSFVNQVVVDAVFYEASGVLGIEQTAVIGFILREQQLGIFLTVKTAFAVIIVIQVNSSD